MVSRASGTSTPPISTDHSASFDSPMPSPSLGRNTVETMATIANTSAPQHRPQSQASDSSLQSRGASNNELTTAESVSSAETSASFAINLPRFKTTRSALNIEETIAKTEIDQLQAEIAKLEPLKQRFNAMLNQHTERMAQALACAKIKEEDTADWLNCTQLHQEQIQHRQIVRRQLSQREGLTSLFERSLNVLKQKQLLCEHRQKLQQKIEKIQRQDPETHNPLSNMRAKFHRLRFSFGLQRCKRVLGFFLYFRKSAKEAYAAKIQSLRAEIWLTKVRIEKIKRTRRLEEQIKELKANEHKVQQKLAPLKAQIDGILEDIQRLEEKDQQHAANIQDLLNRIPLLDDLNKAFDPITMINALHTKVQPLNQALCQLRSTAKNLSPTDPLWDRIETLSSKTKLYENTIDNIKEIQEILQQQETINSTAS